MLASCKPARRRRLLGVLALVLALALSAAGAAEAHGFMTGFADGVYLNPKSGDLWLDRTVSAGASFVLLPVSWPAIEPSPPAPGSDPSNPANPALHWGTLDHAVREAVARGLTVAFTVAGAGGPAWADGSGRPASAPVGTWRPNARAFAAFAKAVAERFSGRFDPGDGVLPRVRYYEAWGEPNLPDHLNPQWIRVHGRPVAESPIIYRALLNAFYFAVKSVNAGDMVISAGTAPFGTPPSLVGGPGPLFDRVPPALFVRRLLCLSDALKPLRCPDPVHFDILAHHPYAIGGPFWHAYDRDDISIADFYKLTRPLAVAERTGRVLPRGRKQLWVTEFSWNSDPPNPHAVPMARWTRWIEESFYELWREGVDALAWYNVVDQPPVPNYGSTYQSGMYFLNGRPKPGLRAFRFPFVVEPVGGGRRLLWGISPRGGVVAVQRRVRRGWQTGWRFHVRAHGIFERTVRVAPGTVLRARVEALSSVPWRVG